MTTVGANLRSNVVRQNFIRANPGGNVDHFTSHNITPTSISSVTSFLLYSFFQDEALSYSSEITSTTNHFDSEDTGRSVSWP